MLSRNTQKPSAVQYDQWSSGIMKSVENAKLWHTFLMHDDAAIDIAKLKMFVDADGAGAGGATATNQWGKGAWLRLSSLMTTTFRNNYASPVNVEVVAFKRRKFKSKYANNMTAELNYPLMILEHGYNQTVQDPGDHCFGTAAWNATEASSDIQVELSKMLTHSNRKQMPYSFGRSQKRWLQPGQTMTLSKKALYYEKFHEESSSMPADITGYMVVIHGTVAHNTATPPTSVGYIGGALDFVQKVYNKLVYQGAVYGRFTDYFPDDTVLGSTLEVLLPRDPAAETNPTGT